MQLISEMESSGRPDFRTPKICIDLMSTVKVFKTLRIDVSLNLVGFDVYG